MEKKSPAKPATEGSPSTPDDIVQTDLLVEEQTTPPFQEIIMGENVGGEEEPLPEDTPAQTPEKAPEKKREGPSSAEKKKTKVTPAASSSKKTTADSSNTESAHTETKAVEEKDVSEEGSSGDALGEDEEEVNAQPEDDDDVEFLAEQPAKRARVGTRSSKRGRTQASNAKELAKSKEVVVPKRLDAGLLERLRVMADVERLFKGIGWGRFLE